MALDKFLENVPDQPKIDSLTPGTQNSSGIYSNSLLHQIKRGQGGGAAAQFRGLGQRFIVLYCISPALGPTSGPREGLQGFIA